MILIIILIREGVREIRIYIARNIANKERSQQIEKDKQIYT